MTVLNQAIDDKVKKEVDEAVVHAKNDPEPSPEELYSHVYSQLLPGMQYRGCDPFTYFTPTKWSHFYLWSVGFIDILVSVGVN